MTPSLIKTTPHSRWLAPCEPRRSAALRLICLAHAGGNASMYLPWSRQLSDEFELWTVQLPGRGMRMNEELVTSFEEIVASIAPAIADLSDKPIAMFGHSLGARLAFETARWMRRHAFPLPVKIFASAAAAPHIPRKHPPLSTLPEPELIEKLRQFNGIPEPSLANRELLDIVLPVVRADFSVAESYRFVPEPKLAVPLDALYGLDDPEVGREYALSWQEHTSASFGVRGFPGGHFYLHPKPGPLLPYLFHELTALRAEPIA